MIPQPGTFVDNKTNDSTPTFWGTAEANSIIRVFADRSPQNGVLDANDVLIGQTVTMPFDGNNQFPNGQWSVTSVIDRNVRHSSSGHQMGCDGSSFRRKTGREREPHPRAGPDIGDIPGYSRSASHGRVYYE